MEILSGEPYENEIRELILEYTNSLGRDLTFQNLNEELEDLRAKYAGCKARLLAALEDGKVVGCVALKPFDDGRCEMKRLFVKPEYRSLHIGQALVEAAVGAARELGYRSILLDTLVPLQSAVRLYRRNGFREIPAYYDNPMDDVIYMELEI